MTERALFLRGLWWRRWFSVAVLLVGVIAAGIAAIGPLYARAASESTLTDELRSAGSKAGLAFSMLSFPNNLGPVTRAERRIASKAKVRGYGPPIIGESISVSAATSGAVSSATTMVSRSDQCAHLVMVIGRCPTSAGEVAVPENTRENVPNWQVGQLLIVHQVFASLSGNVDGPVIATLRIVGAYRARDIAQPYWFGLPYFDSQLGPAVSSINEGGVDAIFVAAGQFAARLTRLPPSPYPVMYEVDVDRPLIATDIRLDDLARLRREVALVQARFPRSTSPPVEPTDRISPAMSTGLSTVLRDAARDQRAVQTATLVVVLELSALSMLVLFEVVGRAVSARGGEIALAKLRGLRPWRTAWFALREPLVLLLIAAPLGLLLGLGVAHLLTGAALVAGTPVVVGPPVGWALAAAFGGAGVAAGSSAITTLARPVLDQWRNTSARRRTRRWLFDGLVAVAAVGTLLALRVGDGSRPSPVFLLAPALLVSAVALMGTRLLPRLGRLALGPTRSSRFIATFLAIRQTVRRPGGRQLALVLAVSAGLATFAVCGEAIARGNRVARAETEVGGVRRVSVQLETAHDPEAIVDRVDPGRRWAMATAVWSPDGGPSSGHTVVGLLMGVQPDRLPATAFRVRGQLSPNTEARAITSSGTGPPVEFHASQLRVTLTISALAGDRSTLSVNYRADGAVPHTASGGRLRIGTHTYAAALPCIAGCAFTGLTFDRSINAANLVTGTATVRGISTATAGRPATPLPIALTAGSWHAAQVGDGANENISTAAGQGGVRAVFRSTDGASPVLAYTDSPASLPIVATPASLTNGRDSHTGAVLDYTGASLPYTVRRYASPLPVVLNSGAIGDLDYLRARLPDFDRESSWSVWLGPAAPVDALRRLEDAGLLIQHQYSVPARVAVLARQGPALGLLLLLVCAIAAAILAVGGTAVAMLADGRRRTFELAALRAVGVPHQAIRRSAVAEQALLLGTAIILGLPAGYFAAALVMPVVPQFSDATPAVLRFDPPILLAIACGAALAVLLTVAAVIAGHALARAAVPARLREPNL